jgi:hypothetical protein
VTLAERAVACKGWRWLPGMLTAEGYRVVVARAVDGECLLLAGDERKTWHDDEDAHQPDLDDPCTLGGLLALVREAWGEPVASISWWDRWAVDEDTPGWDLTVGDLPVLGIEAPSEAEALVCALEAAP